MWQSVLRIVLALLTTAVGASLLIGTVGAKGPVPEQPPVVKEGTPSGIEEVIATRLPVTTVVSDLGISTVFVATPEEAAAYGVPMATEIQVSCKKAHHTFRHGRYKLEAELRFCWNTSHPPSEITSHDRYKAVGTAQRPSYVVGKPWHKKWDGGAGFRYVDTKAKGKFCTPSLQEDFTWLCEGYTRLYIDAEHKVGGESNAWGAATFESLN